MTTIQSAGIRIEQEVTSWPGVEAGPGERGELSFKVGRREIGHLHGDYVLHTSFPMTLWTELHEEGRIDYHPVSPGKPGYAARGIETEEDILDVIELLRINYDRAIQRYGMPHSRA